MRRSTSAIATNFPDPKRGILGYNDDPSRKIVVTYSSINGNGFGGYGEIVMGTKGTLVLEKETEALLYKNSDTSSKVTVKKDKGEAVLNTTSSGTNAPVAKATDQGPVSRGYTEQIEHFAWCIRNPAPDHMPRCHPVVALGDAVMALTSKLAIANSNTGQGGFIKFEEDWFDPMSDATPDGSSVEDEYQSLVKKAKS